jgi:hypothetical protein
VESARKKQKLLTNASSIKASGMFNGQLKGSALVSFTNKSQAENNSKELQKPATITVV